MSKYYEKDVGNGEKFLYDSSGKCIGRGVTDENGKTIYSGAGGYVGKSYETGHGTVKHYDADNNYVGGGIKRSSVSTIQSSSGKSIDGTAPHRSDSKNGNYTYNSQPVGDGCATSLVWIAIISAILFILNLFT